MELGYSFAIPPKSISYFSITTDFISSLINSDGNCTCQGEFRLWSSFWLMPAQIGWHHKKSNVRYLLLSISKPKPNLPITAKLNLTFLSNYRFQLSLINSIGNSTFQEEFGPRSSFHLILAWIGWDHEKTNICFILLSISKPKPNHLQKTGSSFSLENSISFITFVWDNSIETFFNKVSALKFW